MLHHAVTPVRAARQWATDALARIAAVGATRVAVVGFGLGHHVEALASLFDGEIVVLEPDVGLLRLALATRDVARLLERIELRVEVQPEPSEADGTCVLTYAPLLVLPGGEYAKVARNWELAAARSAGPLRILVVSPMYGGSHPIALHAHRALSNLGHEAVLLDLGGFFPGFQRLAHLGGTAARQRQTESLFCESLANGIAGRVEKEGFDLVLALAQAPLDVRALEAIRAAGAVSALWFVEDRRVFPYWREIGPHYDSVFTIQGGDALVEMQAAGVRHAHYLPCAADPRIHRPMELSAEERARFGSAVSFVGAGYRNRRQSFRRFLDTDFRLWGSDWSGASGFERVLERAGARIPTEDSIRIWNASAVNLNLHSSTYCDGVDPRGDFVNPRTFEIAACGAFQVVDHRALLPDLFEVGREMVAVGSVAEMREATGYYLEHPDPRREIAGAALHRVLREHTYERRMEELVATVRARHAPRLEARTRRWTVGDARAETSGGLREYLERLPDDTPFTLEEMVRPIPEAEGPLSEPEALFLFLSQFDSLYLAEHRR